MELITEADVQQAQQEAAAAAALLDVTEKALAGQEFNDGVAARLGAASARARWCAARADKLSAQLLQQQAALSARAEAEAAVRPTLAKTAKALHDKRAAAQKALATAEQAMLAAVDAATEYEELVRETSQALVRRGLPVKDEYGEYATGGVPDGPLRLDGAWFLPLPPAHLFARSVGIVATAAWGFRHPIATWGKAQSYTTPLRSVDGAAFVEELPTHKPRPAALKRLPVPEMAPVQGAPVYMTEWARQQFEMDRKAEERRDAAAHARYLEGLKDEQKRAAAAGR